MPKSSFSLSFFRLASVYLARGRFDSRMKDIEEEEERRRKGRTGKKSKRKRKRGLTFVVDGIHSASLEKSSPQA